ncbi:MAG: hypothetical protein LH467_08150 [Gemmatimonadaceae bacterium]|nr:hypothetical protein [Gemmatimonadaceae bacterium]
MLRAAAPVQTRVAVVRASIASIRQRNEALRGNTDKVALHFVLFLFVAGGFIASVYKLTLVGQPKPFSYAALSVLGLTLLTNLAVGVTMASLKHVNLTLVLVHRRSTLVMSLSIFASILFLVMRV